MTADADRAAPGVAFSSSAQSSAARVKLRVRAAALDAEHVTASVDRTLAALADPDRRRAVDVLRQGPRRAGELAHAIGVAAPAMSRHLRVLRQTGLVEESHPEFDARVRIYSLRAEPIAELRAWLELTEQLWIEQLAAFKAHVERV